jgi:hypothetical protein
LPPSISSLTSFQTERVDRGVHDRGGYFTPSRR